MIAIIDLDSVVFSIGYSKDKEKTEQELKDDTDSIMTNILNWTKSTGYIGYIKGRNTIDRRKLFCEDYKANRKGEIPAYWSFVKQYLIDKWNAFEVNNMETDDAVNITRLKIKDSFICCIDSDLLGCEGKHYNWRKLEWLTSTKQDEQRNFWSSMITGTHNGVKGIPKKGIKFVEKLFSAPETISYPMLVLNAYIVNFGEEKGIKEFYNTYNCIKLLEEDENFVIPSINEWVNEFKNKVEAE